ncbi:MAG: PstS family phosphate ABC transporter substrate-binding protein [Candidatus Omnitrophota bacterium]
MKMMKYLAMAAAALLFAGGPGRAEMLQIKGSDTLINLVQRLSEAYMQKNPGQKIAVTGGGSGTGIAALVNGKCDIANASRLMKKNEVAQAGAAGIDPVQVVVAVDGLSLIVNANNGVDGLTMDQIGKIYRGEVKNWSQVGGRDMPITLYGRQSNSGTYDFMMEVVLKGDYSPKMNQMNGNAQIVAAIKNDPSGIGYVGVSYVKDASGIKVLKVAQNVNAVYASPLNIDEVNSGVYPVSRPLNQYLSADASQAVRDFIAFELSPEGQRIVEEEGFFALPQAYKDYNKKSGF